jgi:hypothetical protein
VAKEVVLDVQAEGYEPTRLECIQLLAALANAVFSGVDITFSGENKEGPTDYVLSPMECAMLYTAVHNLVNDMLIVERGEEKIQ